MPRPRPSRAVKFFYGLGSVAFGVKDNGFSYFLLLYYNQVLGLPEAWVGAAILTALVLDAVSDPVVGWLSDHLHSRWGRRHPFMYAAVIPVTASYFLLWTPPAGLSPAALFAWLLGVAVLVRTCITLYEIPSSSLVAELTDDYDERTQLLSYRYFFGWWGGLTMAVLAYAVFLQPDAAHPIGVLNADGWRTYGRTASLVMGLAILASSLGTHAFIPHLRRPPQRPVGVRGVLREMRETLANRSFLVLFGAGACGAMATGLAASINVYFNTYFWEITSSQIAVLALGNFLSAAVALGVAPRLSRRFGKKRAAIAVGLTALTLAPLPIVLRLLGWFPPNGSPVLLPLLFVAGTTTVALVITSSILVAAMVADVVEESELATGRRSEGVFFAVRSFIDKAVSGVGIFASTLVLGAVGFPRGATPGAVDPTVIRLLGLAYVPLLVGLYGTTLAFLGAYRISRATHEDTLRRLADRSA